MLQLETLFMLVDAVLYEYGPRFCLYEYGPKFCLFEYGPEKWAKSHFEACLRKSLNFSSKLESFSTLVI